MKTQLLSFFLLFFGMAAFAQNANFTFHDYSAASIEGDTIDFSAYYGKKVMVVNTASYCAFTPQFHDLQTLYNQYNQYNFEIIGFPCNDFDNQDPGNDSTILNFCTENYGVTFQMMSKIKAVVPDTAPVFRWLQEGALNGVSDAPITWNFNKFLIDEAGHWVAYHNSLVNPTSSVITDWIMSPSALGVANADKNEKPLVELFGSAGAYQMQLQLNDANTRSMDIRLYATDGQLIDVIYSGTAKGTHRLSYDVSSLPSGIYLIRASAGTTVQTLRYAVIGQ
ncbi:MAG: T9SS type A sorting domain-containing protein [Flavobacteriales bacterium]|nr:T9SS type A sorting domain-containing protein [Flavobacteriales bacterium]